MLKFLNIGDSANVKTKYNYNHIIKTDISRYL